MAKRDKQIAKEAREARQARLEYLQSALARGELPVDRDRLAVSYFDQSDFMRRGTYIPVEFTCRECGKVELWTPHQQKWWYEVAKGNVSSTAIMCRPCRRRERDRRAEARRVHLEGIAQKSGRRPE
ncbi:MAG: zinc-ribbon domain containing protein [Hyphomicrobiales bacterium]